VGPLEAIVAITAIVVAIGIPVGGLVIRFALRPLVQDIANAIRSGNTGEQGHWESLSRRLERIEASLVEQEAVTSRLLEVQEFERKLRSGRAEDPPSGGM
jgi:NhaP-type Na+/H+ or K+/H+ antiporter